MHRILVSALLLSSFGLLANAVAQDGIKDRKAYIPNRKQAALPGIAVGILLSDGQPVLSTEGRSGPADQLVFSTGGNSYRWVYVPAQGNAQITNLQVPVGDKGEIAVYPALNLANPPSVLPWAIKTQYTLVEVEVNAGKGSPAGDSFVATNFKVLDGTKDYPLKVVEVVLNLKERYAEYVTKEQASVEKAMTDLAAKAIPRKKATGPREKKELMYVTWLADAGTLRVHFQTTISDGAYQIIDGAVDPKRPPPLPVPPAKKAAEKKALEQYLLRVAPPKFGVVKVGTTFGIEFGRAYVVNKKGEVIATEDLPIETFTQQLNVRPNIGPGPRPNPPPLPKKA